MLLTAVLPATVAPSTNTDQTNVVRTVGFTAPLTQDTFTSTPQVAFGAKLGNGDYTSAIQKFYTAIGATNDGGTGRPYKLRITANGNSKPVTTVTFPGTGNQVNDDYLKGVRNAILNIKEEHIKLLPEEHKLRKVYTALNKARGTQTLKQQLGIPCR
jgi:hypothetical protein